MESLPNSTILEFNPDTLQYIRKQYDLSDPKILEEAINILEEWIQKQEHFEEKKFRRDYLERLIIYNKGSIEKCKRKLDVQCTLRTLVPELYEVSEFTNRDFMKMFQTVLLPKMTPDYGRVCLLKTVSTKYDASDLSVFFKYVNVTSDYVQTQDYCNHLSFFTDFRDGNILEFVKALNVVEVRQVIDPLFRGASMRIKGIHFLTPSKAIDTLLSFVKPLLSAKIADRMHVHTTLESLYDHIPKEILPKEFGGIEKPSNELCENMFKELTSSNVKEYRREMQRARTNEAFRRPDQFNDEYMGISGTFRALSVD